MLFDVSAVVEHFRIRDLHQVALLSKALGVSGPASTSLSWRRSYKYGCLPLEAVMQFQK